MKIMIQDGIPICPECTGLLRKICTDTDIVYVCNDCKLTLTVIDYGQSERELKCQIKNTNIA